MQSIDDRDRIVQSVPVDLENASDLVAKIKTALDAGAVKHTIANLPKTNEIVDVNGLRFKVEFADYVKGQFKVKLVLV